MVLIRLLVNLVPCLLFGYLVGPLKPNLSLTVAQGLINFRIAISLIGLLLKAGIDWRIVEAEVWLLTYQS